ncbi:MAG: hypothetical protein ACE5GC_09575 [Acidimicrobiia bacterium]
MDEDRRKKLAALLASPVDDDPPPHRRERPRRRPRGSERSWPPALLWVLGVIAGGAIVVAAYAVSRTGAPQATASAAIPPSVATSPPTTTGGLEIDERDAEFPDGYTPIDELVAARFERSAIVGDAMLLTFTTAVRSGFDPELSAPLNGGSFDLVLEDGSSRASTGFAGVPFSRGVFTVVFDGAGIDFDDVTGVMLTERWFRTQIFTDTDLDASSLPFVLASPLDQQLAGGVTLVVEEAELTREGGTIEWRLEGTQAIVRAAAEITTGFNDRTPAVMFDRAFLARDIAFDGDVARSGTIQLTAPVIESDEIFSARIQWAIDLVTTTPAQVPIPVDAPRE